MPAATKPTARSTRSAGRRGSRDTQFAATRSGSPNCAGLMSDAGHNLIDQGSLFLALYAHILAARPATEERTFGYHRAGIVTAFINALILLFTALIIAVLAVKRIIEPVPIAAGWVILIALLSFGCNLGIALLLKHGAQEDLNIRSAFLHMLSDAWVSLEIGRASCRERVL